MYVSGEDTVLQENASLQANYFLTWSLAGWSEKSLGDDVPPSSKMKIKDSAGLHQQRFNFYLFFIICCSDSIRNPAFIFKTELKQVGMAECLLNSAVWMKDFSPSQRDAVTFEGRKKGAVMVFFSSEEVQLTGISTQLLIRWFIRALIGHNAVTCWDHIKRCF